VGALRLTSKAAVKGNLTYWSDNEASIDANARVAGAIEKKVPSGDLGSPQDLLRFFAGVNLFFKIVTFVSTLILSLLLLHFLPRFTRDNVAVLRERYWQSLGFGALVLVATPIVAFLLIATLLGLPLGLILLSLYITAIFVSRIFVALWLGLVVLEKIGRRAHEAWAMVIGLFIFSALGLIPILGGIISLVAILLGLGALVLTLRTGLASARARK
jgi:hypothetical protein